MSFLDPITQGGPATELATTGAPVVVNQSAPPTPGQVLVATSATNADWQDGAGGAAELLATAGAPVDISSAAPPAAGQVLTALSATVAEWADPAAASPDAAGLQTNVPGAPVNVSAANPPIPGQVLSATSATDAIWRVPGLTYDASIKFWIDSTGSATIEPNTWGFVQTIPAGWTDPVIVNIVSDFTAPPADSRVGIYVARTMTVPVIVQLVGASQIMGLDNVLTTSVVLLPGAMYEWVLYHDGSDAVWGLVSDTAGVAKRLGIGSNIVAIAGTSAPTLGQVLTAVDGAHAQFQTPAETEPALQTIANAMDAAEHVYALATVEHNPSSTGDLDVDGVSAADHTVLLTAQTDLADNGFWTVNDGSPWTRLSDPDVGSLVIVDNGITQALAVWFNAGGGVWQLFDLAQPHPAGLALGAGAPTQITVAAAAAGTSPDAAHSNHVHSVSTAAPAALTVGGAQAAGVATSLTRSDHVHAMPGLATGAVSGFLSSADKTRLDGMATGAAAVGSTPATQVTVTTATVGVATTAARSDHEHSVSTAAPAALTVGGAQAAGVATSLPRSDHAHAMPGLATTSTDGFMSAADKSRSDASQFKAPVRAIATSNITLSGTQTVDGVSLVAGNRAAAVGQTIGLDRGIYVVSAGAWTRATDADTSAKVLAGMQIPVTEGGSYQDTIWTLTTNDPITLGTTALAFKLTTAPIATGIPSDVGAPSGAANTGTVNRWALEDHQHQLQAPDPGFNGFRLSNNASSSIYTEGSASAVWMIPHTGNRIGLTNSGVSFYPVTPSANPTISITGQTAGIPCDVFCQMNSTTSVSLVLTPWTNATTRATALVQNSGVWLKSGTPSQRYVGTILPDSATTYSMASAPGSAAKAVCGLWNQDNRISSNFTWRPSAANTSPAVADTWEAFTPGAPHIEFVLGQSIDAYAINGIAAAAPGAGSSEARLGIGVDSATAPSGLRDLCVLATSSTGGLKAMLSQRSATVGRKTANLLISATLTSAVFYGQYSVMQSGLSLDIRH